MAYFRNVEISIRPVDYYGGEVCEPLATSYAIIATRRSGKHEVLGKHPRREAAEIAAREFQTLIAFM